MFTNPNAEIVVETLAPDRVVLYGVATDVCDRYAIDGLRVRWPRLPIFAVTDAMKPIHADVAGCKGEPRYCRRCFGVLWVEHEYLPMDVERPFDVRKESFFCARPGQKLDDFVLSLRVTGSP